jgi:hypothetical protein
MKSMQLEVSLPELSKQALECFPPLGKDRGAASNFAQRQLTKIIAEARKSGKDITEDEAQALRASLESEINAFDTTSLPADDVEHATPKPIESDVAKPSSEIMEALIADCFHTASDGSSEHLKHLQQKALNKVEAYLTSTDAGWMERRRFTKQAKQLIQRHMADMAPE